MDNIRPIDAYTLAEIIENLDITVAGKPARWNDAKYTVLKEIANAPTVDAVIPPCKVGDTVFVLTSDSITGVEKSRVKRMQLINLQDGMTIKIIIPCVCDDWGGAVREVYPEDFGKTVFLTPEEAKKAIAERQAKG